MSRSEGRGIVDQSAVRMRVATIAAGVWLTYVVCGAGSVYLAFTWQRPNRTAIALLFTMAIISAAVIARLPREEIVRSRYREVFFFVWSALDLVLIVLVTLADGGTASPFALTFFMPVVFAALSYPLGSVAAVGGLSVAAYLGLSLTVGGAGWDYQALFSVMLTCAGGLSAWQARNHERQRLELIEVSRADPLTGCLNRRGFEERARAEISAAGRRAGRGALLMFDIDHFKPVNDRYGHAVGDELLRWVVQAVRTTVRPTDAIGRLGGDEFGVLFEDIEPTDARDGAARIAEVLAERAPCSFGLATFPADGDDFEELMRKADIRLYASRHGRADRDLTGIAERMSWAATLAQTVDLRMNAEHEHSRSVAELAVAIAMELGWKAEMLDALRMAAMLHDVGKVTIPDEILCKPGRLSDSEFETIKGHSAAGADLVAQIEGLDAIVPWIRHSHENFDGSGYPDGLCGEAIPEASRIMLVADAFDAITSSRPYRDGLPTAHACEELKRNAGTQFDPVCVTALLDCLGARMVPEPLALA